MPASPSFALESGPVKVALVNQEFMSEFPPGRYPAGAVLSVSEGTAQHWYDRRIAVPAAEHARTHIQERRETLMAELAALEKEAGPVGKYNASMHSAPPTQGVEQPPARRGRPPKADTAVINLPEPDEDEE